MVSPGHGALVRRGWSRFLLVLFGCALLACTRTSSNGPESPGGARRGPPIDFAFPPDGENVVNSTTTRGRVTVLAFVTTYDLVSQLVLRRLADVIVRFTPRANAAAVVLEAPLYADLLPAYRASMGLPFPIVMADHATQMGQGHFGDITRVPTLVFLDRDGREVWRHQGRLESAEIERALQQADEPR